MLGRLLLHSVGILWLVQTAHTGGYGAASGVPTGQGPHLNGRKPQNGGGVGRMLMPSKGVGQPMGAQNGYGGYPTKGIGYGAAAGVPNGGGTKGYGASAGATNGQPQGGNPAVVPNGNGAKSNGYGGQAGPNNGQPIKGNGYGAPVAVAPGNGGRLNGYAPAAGVLGGNGAKPSGGNPAVLPSGNGAKSNGYGAQAGPHNGQQVKGNGYGAHAGGYGGQGTKGNGYGAGSGVPNGNGAKTNGQGAGAGSSGANGARPNGGAGAGSKPMKGYGRPPYGAGPGVGMGVPRGMGVPQLARNQRAQAYGGNGYNGYGAQPRGGYNGRYGNGGLGHGPQYGNGGMKGPKPGYGAAAGVPNGQGAKTNGYAGARAANGNGALPNGYGYPNGGATKPVNPGYGNIPTGYGTKPNGYGATRGGSMKPQPGYGNGAPLGGYGSKPNGYGPGAGAGVPRGHAAKPTGHGVRNGAALGGYGGYGGPSAGSKPQNTKGVGAVSPSEGAKTPGTGFGAPAGGLNGQLAKTPNTGFGPIPNGKGVKAAGASNGKGLKGGVLSPEQPGAAAAEEVVGPQHEITQDVAPVAPEPTSGILVMVTQEKYQKLPSPVPQGKSYKQMPLIPPATPEPAPAILLGKAPKPALEPTPEEAPTGPYAAASEPEPAVTDPAPEQAPALPQGYVTGSAVPEQNGADADVLFGVDSTAEGDAAPESPQKNKAVPETVAAKSTDTIIPEEALAVGEPEVAPEEANVKSQPEAGPDRLGGKSLPAGETGATVNGGGASASKGQGAKPAKPDCGPSGVPNGQWMKIPRPGYNAGAEGAGSNTKGYGAGAGVPNGYGAKPNGYGASAGGYSNGGGAKANKPGHGVGGFIVPGLGNGYGAGGPGYPYGLKPQQPAYGQRAYLGAGYGNGNSYGGNPGLGEAGKSKSGYGNGNGYSAGVQPDFASLGQGGPVANGGAKQIPYNGAPVVPAGLDGMSHVEPQSAGLGPNGKLGNVYGGMPGSPFPAQPVGAGAAKSSAKYGIGGLQFGGQPLNTGINGAGHYGYGGSPYGPAGDGKSSPKYGYNGFPNGGQLLGFGSNGNVAGKYGYGRMPYEAQPAGLSPQAKSGGKYAGSQYHPEPVGLGQSGKLTGKYDNQGPHQSQPLESTSDLRSAGEYDTAGLSYEPLPLEPDSAGKSYVKGEVPTPAIAAEGDGMSIDRYDNVGYINGQVQPQVVAFPAAPSPSPTLAYPSAPSYLSLDSSIAPDALPETGLEDLPDPATGLTLDSAPAAETLGVAEVPEQTDEQQLPRQIHIQQHLKLHFHHQGKKNGKYDLNGFFGNSGYQG